MTFPYRNIILRTSLGLLKVMYSAGAGSIQWSWETGFVMEGSTFGTMTYNPAGQTFAKVESNFYIYGETKNYQVRVSGKYYELYDGNNFLGTIGYMDGNAVAIPIIGYDTAHDAYFVDSYTIYRNNATMSDPTYSITQVQVSTNEFGYIVVTGLKTTSPGTFTYNSANGSKLDLAVRDILGNAIISNPDPYDTLPVSGDDPLPGGGAVPEPGLPGLSAASTGIMGLFCPTVSQMQQLSDFMWTDFGGQGTTVIEVLEEIVEAIKRAISNPLDYIFGLNIIPSQGLSIGASKVVKFGFVSSGVSMPMLTDHYFIVDCGSVSFDVLCGDSFLDYAPYSKFSIYLPYIGFKDIDPNDCVGHTISVKYHGDAITGGLTAYVFKDGNVMYQYSGGCALNVPLSSDNWGATIASAASIATGVIAAAGVPGAAGVASAGKALLKSSAANVASNPSLLSPQVMHSGAVSGAPGFMGVQYPFIIREAVNFHSTEGFNRESGYPAYYYKSFSDVSGFTTILDPHINNIPQATQGEMNEIISLLESGVIL